MIENLRFVTGTLPSPTQRRHWERHRTVRYLALMVSTVRYLALMVSTATVRYLALMVSTVRYLALMVSTVRYLALMVSTCLYVINSFLAKILDYTIKNYDYIRYRDK